MNQQVDAYYLPEQTAPVAIRTRQEMNALVDDLLRQGFDYSIADLYVRRHRPDSDGATTGELEWAQLELAVNAEDGVGGLCYLGRWYSKGKPSEHDEVFYSYMGNDRDFPHDSEISLDAVREAAAQFLASGGERPTNIEWQDSGL